MGKFRVAKHTPRKRTARTARTSVADQVGDLKRLLTEMGRVRPLRDPLSAIDERLTPPQIHSVVWLGAEGGSLPASVLCQRVGCGQPTITGVVDRLEKLGYVERVRGTDDRRVVHVKLTTSGVILAAKLDERVTERLGLFLGSMTSADRADFLRIVGKIVDTFRTKGAALESE